MKRKNKRAAHRPTPSAPPLEPGTNKSSDSAAATRQSNSDSLKPWRDRHELYLGDAKERIGRARNVLLVWIAALVTVWLSTIEKAIVVTDSLHSDLQVRHGLELQNSKYDRALAFLASLQEWESPRSSPVSQLDELEKTKRREAKNLVKRVDEDKLESKRDDAQRKAEEKIGEGVSFKISDFEFPVPTVLSPTIWLALLVAMLCYITNVRRAILRSLGRALRIEREHLEISPLERLAAAPWWLDPLPESHIHDEPRSTEMDLALGWRPFPTSFRVGVIIAILILSAVIWRVLNANMALVSDFSEIKKFEPSLKIQDWHIKLAEFAPPVLVGLGAALVAYWRRPFPGLALLAGETPGAQRSKTISRRQFINVGFATSCGIAGFVCSKVPAWLSGTEWFGGMASKGGNRSRDRHRLLAKLDRIRTRRTASIEGIEASMAYLNPNSTAPRVHVSTPSRGFRFPKTPKLEKKDLFVIPFDSFEPVAGKTGNRIALGEVSWDFECKAIKAAQENRFSDACDILLCAVRHDFLHVRVADKRPNFRLYDLLAGLSVRGKTDHLTKLITLIVASPLHQAFQDRIQTWGDLNARWRRRWAGETKSKRKVWEASIADAKSKDAQKKVLRLSMNA